MDSKMDDTPANYNQINQRFEGENEQPIPEYDMDGDDGDEGGEHMA
jgi:hypothetical protein